MNQYFHAIGSSHLKNFRLFHYQAQLESAWRIRECDAVFSGAMMKTFVGAKIHGIRVTDKSVEYNGSVSVCQILLAEAGMEAFERVDVVNLTTGARWTTYLLPDEERGRFSLNGGGARLGEIGDQCVLMTWNEEESFSGAQVIFCDELNHIRERMSYTNPMVLR